MSVVYTDFNTEFLNIESSIELKTFFMFLDKESNISMYDDIIEKCQSGYCEDLCIYFYFKYKGIKVECINHRHHIIRYEDKLYDSKTLNGVDTYLEIPFFLGEKVTDIHEWNESEIPEYYRKMWNEMNKDKRIGK